MAIRDYATELVALYEKDKTAFLFTVGMWWRVLYGAIRVTVGLGLLHFVGGPFQSAYFGLMSRELIEDPNDNFVKFVGALLGRVPFDISYFLAFYMIFWGVIDVVLSLSVLKEKKWAFPLTMVLIGLFVVYELYRFSYTHSFLLAMVICIDFILIWVIGKKYRKLSPVSLST